MIALSYSVGDQDTEMEKYQVLLQSGRMLLQLQHHQNLQEKARTLKRSYPALRMSGIAAKSH